MTIKVCRNLSARTFLEASLQTVADGDPSLRQEVVQLLGGEGLSQRFQPSKSCLSAAAENETMRLSSKIQTALRRVLPEETHLLSIRLSIHCLSLSSMTSCSVCSSTSTVPALANRRHAKLLAWLRFCATHAGLRDSARTSRFLHRRGFPTGDAETFRGNLILAGVRICLKAIFNRR